METKKFNISYTASFISPRDNNLLIWLAKPIDSGYQKISQFLCNQNQASQYRHNDNLIQFFDLSDENIKLEIDIEAMLSRGKQLNDSDLSGIHSEITDTYLVSEKYLEQTPEIIELTHKILADKSTPKEKIEAIFKYIVGNFKYCYPVNKRGVEHLDLKNLEGDCAEYSSLFVTMCRVAGIPARNVTGFVVFDENNQITEHGWSQVYTGQDWVDADTQYASLEKDTETGINKYLFNRPEYSLIFSTGFNLSLTPEVPKDFNLNYPNQIGILMDSRSVQVLQPLAFASKTFVEFTDAITVK